MKRLLAYLFIVLGLGLTFSASTNAATNHCVSFESYINHSNKTSVAVDGSAQTYVPNKTYQIYFDTDCVTNLQTQINYLKEFLEDTRSVYSFEKLFGSFKVYESYGADPKLFISLAIENDDYYEKYSDLLKKNGYQRNKQSIKDAQEYIAKYKEKITEKSIIVKKEPSQTQKVAGKKVDLIFCDTLGVGQWKYKVYYKGYVNRDTCNQWGYDYKSLNYNDFRFLTKNQKMCVRQGLNGPILTKKNCEYFNLPEIKFNSGKFYYNSKIKTQIAKAEPSQTQKVAKKIYCTENRIDEKLYNFKEEYVGKEDHYFYSASIGNVCIQPYTKISSKEYQNKIELFRQKEKKIKNQTQKVAREIDNYNNYQFCSNYVNATRYFIQKKGNPNFSDSSAGADISNKAFNKKRCDKEYSLEGFVNLFLYRGKIDNPTDIKLKNNLNTLYSELNRENLDLNIVNNIIRNSPKLNNYIKFLENKETQIAKTDPTIKPKKKVEITKVEEFKPENKDNKAPVIEIAEAITVNDSTYEIEGKVIDKSKKLFVQIDGETIPVKKGKFKIKRFSPVDEQLKIVALDQWGNKSKPKLVNITIDLKETELAEKLEQLNPSLIKSKLNKDRVALIIGIEKYEQTPAANFANLDAQYFYEYARKGFGISKSNIKLLVDEDADLVKSISSINKWLPSKIKKNKTELIIFFAGHGLASNNGQELYILPQDSDPDLLSRTALSRTELFEQIISLSPKSVTMFMDTCYSGISRDEKMLLASARPIRIIADDQDGIPNNFTIFSASKLDQISSGLKEAKHGIFSYYLMKGLEGKADSNQDNKITNGELLAYMDENVSQKASELGRKQNPSLAGDPNKVLMTYR